MSGAGEALASAVIERLRTAPGIGAVYCGTPRRAALPHAVVDSGVETDWGHKSGAGRELRLTVTLRDGGESGARLRGLADAAEAAVTGIDRQVSGWTVVNLQLLRRRTVANGQGWATVIEYRARLLAD